MALPNPSMSFTPFDILTAEEMNDLVENIEALAAGTGLNTDAITTVKIDDGAVTNPKIDWTTLTQNIIQHDGYVVIGSLQMAWGQSAASSTGTTITFPRAFLAAPVVMTNLADPGAQDPRAYNTTTTQTTLRQSYAVAPITVQWFAIGVAS
jgi:hypothetical protein